MIKCFRQPVHGVGLPSFSTNGGDVYGIFQFSGFNVLWNFYRSIADVHISEQKVKAYGHRKTAPIL